MTRESLSAAFKKEVEGAANQGHLTDDERKIRALVAIALAVRGLWPDVKEEKEPPA